MGIKQMGLVWKITIYDLFELINADNDNKDGAYQIYDS